jgi:hypothetical protein
VSLAALGELVATLAKDAGAAEFSARMDMLHKHIREGRLLIYGLGDRDRKAAELVVSLMERDGLLDPTDAVIVACMLTDEEADLLYTTDLKVLTSKVIAVEARSLGKTLRNLEKQRRRRRGKRNPEN